MSSAATKTEAVFSFTYRFPGDDDAAIAPQSLDEVLDVFDGTHLIDSLDEEIYGADVTLVVSCHPDSVEKLRDLEAGLVALLDNWASSSGGYRV